MEQYLIADVLKPNLHIALENVARLENHYRTMNVEWLSEEWNPMTDVPEIIKALGLGEQS